jgi:hypothetical protein
VTDVLTIGDLRAYPGVSIPSEPTGDLVVRLTNGLIKDIIGELTPIPTRALTIALVVAKRALSNPEGAESITTGLDDWKKTIRYRAADVAGEVGVFLTAAEEDELRDMVREAAGTTRVSPVGSIRLSVPGVDYAVHC